MRRMVIAYLLSSSAATTAAAATAATNTPSNIAFILTDDLDGEFLGVGPLIKTRTLIASAGMQAEHYHVHTPICCPSRAQMLIGRYAHNLRDRDYEPFPLGQPSCGDEAVESPFVGSCGCMRMNCSGNFEQRTFANALQRAGYRTGYFGKYLNPPAMVKYCRNETIGPLDHGWPSGWDEFFGMCDQYSTPAGAYYGVNWVSSRSSSIEYTGYQPANYTTSLIGNRTVDFIQRHASRSGQPPARPFFVTAAVRAPHSPWTPAPWHADAPLPPGAYLQRTGAWNHSTEGKPAWLSLNPPLSSEEAATYDHVFTSRWRALLSVDDLVEAVVDAVAAAGVLETTYVVFASDNGYHYGHFRLPPAKMQVYDFDTRVPFLVRGPGVCPNSTLLELVSNVDLAPTFLDMAGALSPAATLAFDGRSFLPLLACRSSDHAEATRPWRTELPLEYYSMQNWDSPQEGRLADSPANTFRALRIVNASHDALYVETTVVSDWGFSAPYSRELYDLGQDPSQLYNLVEKVGEPARQALHARMVKAWSCTGATCL